MMAGDGASQILNRNNGITNSRYYQQEMYREDFRKISEQLRAEGLFTKSIPDIEHSDLFRLSPFKALTEVVVLQQSLRHLVIKIFRKTPGLSPSMVITPFNVGQAVGLFDLLLVDETHRLSQRAAQSAAVLNKRLATITTRIYGNDDTGKTQLDWILSPAPLFVPRERQDLGGYNFRKFDSVASMQSGILKHDEQNSTQTDWIVSCKSFKEVGSIRTVHLYDLNYVGFIIGLDLQFDLKEKGLFVDRDSYCDRIGKRNNHKLGKTYTDDDLLRFITQIS